MYNINTRGNCRRKRMSDKTKKSWRRNSTTFTVSYIGLFWISFASFRIALTVAHLGSFYNPFLVSSHVIFCTVSKFRVWPNSGSFKHTMIITGPRDEPCGTPLVTLQNSDLHFIFNKSLLYISSLVFFQTAFCWCQHHHILFYPEIFNVDLY